MNKAIFFIILLILMYTTECGNNLTTEDTSPESSIRLLQIKSTAKKSNDSNLHRRIIAACNRAINPFC